MKKYFVIIILLVLSSCENKKENSNTTSTKESKEELVMYVPSEMTKLMLDMFLFQEDSKKRIENGELPLDLPERFKQIHTTQLSDQFEHDASFQGFTTLYYQKIDALSKSTKENAKSNFNSAIQTCIACHETTCHGPITRIKKLIIK